MRSTKSSLQLQRKALGVEVALFHTWKLHWPNYQLPTENRNYKTSMEWDLGKEMHKIHDFDHKVSLP